jgi:hypothetical protein
MKITADRIIGLDATSPKAELNGMQNRMSQSTLVPAWNKTVWKENDSYFCAIPPPNVSQARTRTKRGGYDINRVDAGSPFRRKRENRLKTEKLSKCRLATRNFISRSGLTASSEKSSF